VFIGFAVFKSKKLIILKIAERRYQKNATIWKTAAGKWTGIYIHLLQLRMEHGSQPCFILSHASATMEAKKSSNIGRFVVEIGIRFSARSV